ncbi:MAG: DoxX family protein [Chloroflexi bacterium]|nr:MAG: DoxX family protein [Chloroflexota bacterium]
MSMLKSLSRLLLSGIFISGGADAFLKPGGRVKKVAAFDIPEAEQAVKLNGATMVFAGTALALGIAPKAAATVLIGCLIPTTIVGHPFWKEEDSGSRKNQQVQFLKNLGLMGGLLLVLLEKNK